MNAARTGVGEIDSVSADAVDGHDTQRGQRIPHVIADTGCATGDNTANAVAYVAQKTVLVGLRVVAMDGVALTERPVQRGDNRIDEENFSRHIRSFDSADAPEIGSSRQCATRRA